MDPTQHAVQALLMNPSNDEDARRLLAPVGFKNWQTVWRRLPQLARDTRSQAALVACLPCVFEALREAANPDRAWVNFERFSHVVPDQRALFEALSQNLRSAETLMVLFSSSQFLTEILLRNPEYFERLSLHDPLAQRKTVEQLCHAAQGAMAQWNPKNDTPNSSPTRALEALRNWQRWELLRVGACDLFGLLDLESVTRQLSNLAEALVQTCLTLVANEVGQSVEGFAVVALGKLGGGELNYSSDIDLLFLASSQPTHYQRLAEHLIDALTRIGGEGFLYRVDMRLRPWGQSGALISTCQGFETYVQRHARGWEKQALLKARFVAGERHIVERCLERVRPLIATVPRQLRQEIHAMRQRSQTRLRRRGRLWGEVKSGPGSIRDVEFVTQFLQRLHGQALPHVLSTNTLEALSRLRDARVLDEPDYRTLTDGYTFLRTLEHHLQIMHYQQTHALPSDLDELSRLARRLGFEGAQGKAQLLDQYERHRQAVNGVYQTHLGDVQAAPSPASSRAQRHLKRMHPAYERTFKRREIERHVALIAKLGPEHLVEVEAVEEHGCWRVTIVGYDYLGELSLICGLFVVYGLNILSGHVFSYEPAPADNGQRPRPTGPRPHGNLSSATKIVDVFRVNAATEVGPGVLQDYARALEALLQLLHAGKGRQARARLARRAASALRERSGDQTTLYPVEIDIDNDRSKRHTVLRIRSLDTPGFLYEFSNALTLNGVSIVRVEGRSDEGNVDDVLYVSDARGQKITDVESQKKLRVATVLVKHFTHLLPLAPNPVSALLHFRELVAQLFSRLHWPQELASLERPDVLDALARLLGTSDFLWNDFLRMQHQNLFPVLSDTAALALPKTKAQLRDELVSEVAAATGERAQERALNAFKDRQMFRIDMRHILGKTTQFEVFSAELSDLAEVVVACAVRLCYDELERLFGSPRLHDRSPCPLSVCGLGKCGGRELGFASDIELLFLYAGNGRTSGPKVISTTEFYEKLVERFIGLIRSKREGVFEIDLRLRPYGKAGSMAVSLAAFRRYYARDGEAWAYERQALVKLRPIAGDRALGQNVVALRDELIFGGDAFDPVAMRAMRQRQVRHLVPGGTLNAKFSPGGLVDVEYLVQGLQMRSKRAVVWRACNTRQAMDALKEAGALSPSEYERLEQAHDLLSRLIDALRMARGNAKDLTCPPANSDAFAFLARHLGYAQDTQRLRRDLVEQMAWVQRLSDALLR